MKLNDNQRLVSAKHSHGLAIPVYDDGFGPLWIHRDSMGISGIVRAQTWEEAYEICEDEFFPEADETIDELKAEYGFRREYRKVVKALVDKDDPDYVEAYRRFVRDSDYVDGKLPEGMFSHWKTIDTPDPEAWSENVLFQEGYGFRPSGPNSRDKVGHGIYSKDLNGDSLEPLTDALIKELGLVLEITDYWEVEAESFNHIAYGRLFWPYSGESEQEARAEFEKRKANDYTVRLMKNDTVVEEHKSVTA
jgi:hypothetical protein